MPTPGCKLFFLEMDIQVVMPACSITEIALQYTVMKIGKKNMIIPNKSHISSKCSLRQETYIFWNTFFLMLLCNLFLSSCDKSWFVMKLIHVGKHTFVLRALRVHIKKLHVDINKFYVDMKNCISHVECGMWAVHYPTPTPPIFFITLLIYIHILLTNIFILNVNVNFTISQVDTKNAYIETYSLPLLSNSWKVIWSIDYG